MNHIEFVLGRRHERGPYLGYEEILDAVPNIGPPRETRRVDRPERVIPDVAIPVVALQIARGLNERIRSREPPEERVVDSAVHVNQHQLIQVLMTRESPV